MKIQSNGTKWEVVDDQGKAIATYPTSGKALKHLNNLESEKQKTPKPTLKPEKHKPGRKMF